MKTNQQLIERIEADLAALKAQVVPYPEPPKKMTKADKIREFVAEAKEQDKSRSWVIDRCQSELGMTRPVGWRRLYDLWPTGRICKRRAAAPKIREPSSKPKRVHVDGRMIRVGNQPPDGMTRADQIREFVAEAKEHGKDRSWIMDRCVSELGITRDLAKSHLYRIDRPPPTRPGRKPNVGSPIPKRVTRRDQIQKLVAEAKEHGENRSWVVDRCESELGMNRHLAFSHLTKIWPSGRKIRKVSDENTSPPVIHAKIKELMAEAKKQGKHQSWVSARCQRELGISRKAVRVYLSHMWKEPIKEAS